MTMEAPEVAIVKWKTEDGVPHTAKVKIGENISFTERVSKRLRVRFDMIDGKLNVFIQLPKPGAQYEYNSRRIY